MSVDDAKLRTRVGYWGFEEKGLRNVRKRIYPYYNGTKFAKILQVLEASGELNRRTYRKRIKCLICSEFLGKSYYDLAIPNKSTDFGNKSYSWHEGYKHYIEIHNVKPSFYFRRDVIKCFKRLIEFNKLLQIHKELVL